LPCKSPMSRDGRGRAEPLGHLSIASSCTGRPPLCLMICLMRRKHPMHLRPMTALARARRARMGMHEEGPWAREGAPIRSARRLAFSQEARLGRGRAKLNLTAKHDSIGLQQASSAFLGGRCASVRAVAALMGRQWDANERLAMHPAACQRRAIMDRWTPHGTIMRCRCSPCSTHIGRGEA